MNRQFPSKVGRMLLVFRSFVSAVLCLVLLEFERRQRRKEAKLGTITFRSTQRGEIQRFVSQAFDSVGDEDTSAPPRMEKGRNLMLRLSRFQHLKRLVICLNRTCNVRMNKKLVSSLSMVKTRDFIWIFGIRLRSNLTKGMDLSLL